MVSFAVPVAMGECPGVLATVVVKNRVPWLILVGLVKALMASIQLGNEDGQDVIEWRGPQTRSMITYTPSTHPGVDIGDGIEGFSDHVPDSQKFKRTDDYDKMVGEMKTGGQTFGESPAQASSPWMAEKGSIRNVFKDYRHEMLRPSNKVMDAMTRSWDS